eukprot:s1703_g2.t1
MVIVIITLCQRDSEPQPDPVASAAQEPALHAAGSAAVRCPPAGGRLFAERCVVFAADDAVRALTVVDLVDQIPGQRRQDVAGRHTLAASRVLAS